MTSLIDPRPPVEGTLLDGRFRLRRFLAQGGMGAVYEAEGPAGERLAVKVLLDSSVQALNSGAWARFVREAQVSSSLSSPHIVQVYGGGLDPDTGSAYLAMEFLEGEDLDTLIGRVGPLHPQVAVRLVRQAARGLMVAHEAGIVHRDIKPSNLFLRRQSGEIVVKVCDFGIAKVHPAADQPQLTGTGHVLGSPVYMAPEQLLSSKGVDGRADVWSLAMTLYHALAGEAPLGDQPGFTELVLALTTQPVRPLQQAAPWVSAGLAAVVHGALLRDPEARCPSVAELWKALAPHGGGDDEVTAGMLAGLSEEQRRSVAPPSIAPASWYEAKAQNHEADPLLGKVLVGKYTLRRALGEGGMGAVYEATTSGGEAVACKVLRPDLVGSSPDAMRRMVREARTAMKIDDRHVVRTIEVDTDMALGMPFIAMELLRGADLSALLAAAGPLAPAAVCRLFIDAGAGLGAAHRLGIVHRDIKPANLFLHQTGGPSDPIVVKVCDFGIAKQTDPADAYGKTSTELTRTGGMLGSPLYMSPEQAKNAKGVDHRSDVWSFCMAMYEAFSGQKAWRGFSSPGELVLAICTQDIPPLQDAAPWLPAPFADAVHRGLRRDPAERYQSVDELLATLAPLAASCPVLTLDALRSLTEAQRLVIAERSPRSRRSISPGATSVDSTRDVEPSGARPVPVAPRLLAAVGVAATLAAAGAWALHSPATTTTAITPLPPVAASERAPASATPVVTPVVVVTARVAITPPGAQVSLRGERRPLVDGALELQGEPGESFPLVVEADGVRREATVTLTRDGHALPSSIDLPAASKPTAGRVDPAASSKSGKTAPGAAGAPAAATTPATAATKPPAVGNGAIGEWQ